MLSLTAKTFEVAHHQLFSPNCRLAGQKRPTRDKQAGKKGSDQKDETHDRDEPGITMDIVDPNRCPSQVQPFPCVFAYTEVACNFCSAYVSCQVVTYCV